MERDDPNRETYLKGLALRNSLNMAVMGFRVSEFVIGIGVVLIGLGLTEMCLMAPILYWTRPEAQAAGS
jgi:hypothetical protein